MDKLSTKLKLVRSQSMGVGMGGGGDKMPPNLRPRPNHSTLNGLDQGRQASIVLLDERRLEMHIQPRLYAGELLDLVASHIQVSMSGFCFFYHNYMAVSAFPKSDLIVSSVSV